jgi:hypothetical protein
MDVNPKQRRRHSAAFKGPPVERVRLVVKMGRLAAYGEPVRETFIEAVERSFGSAEAVPVDQRPAAA